MSIFPLILSFIFIKVRDWKVLNSGSIYNPAPPEFDYNDFLSSVADLLVLVICCPNGMIEMYMRRVSHFLYQSVIFCITITILCFKEAFSINPHVRRYVRKVVCPSSPYSLYSLKLSLLHLYFLNKKKYLRSFFFLKEKIKKF